MTEKSEPSDFTKAIECLESGDLDNAEVLFKKTIEKLGVKHNQSHLAYKSLISIASEKGEYNKALNVSLDLLDAQVNTFGIRHAESSRTINNIYTLCNTLGKHELAEEIMSMAKEAEQKTVANSVQKLRGGPEELPEEEEEKIELPGAQTMIGKIAAPVNSFFGILGDRLKRLVCMAIVGGILVTIFGALFIIKYLEPPATANLQNISQEKYTSSDGVVDLSFDESGKAVFSLGDRKVTLPTTYYSSPSSKFASLLLTPVNAKEFWIYKTPHGIDGVGNYSLYTASAKELDIVAMMKNVMTVSNRWFKEQQQYPSSFHTEENADMFLFDNPFTLREDYPIVQKLKLPDGRFNNMNQLIGTLRVGGRWTDEASLYPGAINCAHVVAETENSFLERFVIHACDRNGWPIRDSSGNVLLLVSSGGVSEEEQVRTSSAILGATRVAVIDQSMSGWSLLLRYRLTIFYIVLALIFLGVGKVIPDTVAKFTSQSIGYIAILLAIVTALVWYLPI